MVASLLFRLMTPAPGVVEVAGMSTSQIVMLVLAVAGLTILMLSTRRRVREHQQQPRSTARARYAELERKASAKRDIEEVMLELDQLSRQVHGQLDTKFAKLEAVIRDADQRIDRLSRLLQTASARPTCDLTLGVEDPHTPPTAPDLIPEDQPHTTIYRLADAGVPAPEIATKIDRPVGEVELILALRRTRAQPERASGPEQVAPANRGS